MSTVTTPVPPQYFSTLMFNFILSGLMLGFLLLSEQSNLKQSKPFILQVFHAAVSSLLLGFGVVFYFLTIGVNL
ncbi:hypothetical protein HDU92_008657 [Lobulomyces angularis]|nr:hypothetical protein HDU92_008657 [Lobulomyces angularis]